MQKLIFSLNYSFYIYINKVKWFSFFIFSVLFINITWVQAQTITPYVINNGGGSATGMEWSMGESVSIAHFNTNNYSLNTGVLQPLTNIVTAINEYGPAVFGNQITIGPNPTTNLVHVKARFNEMGVLSFQMIDAKSTIKQSLEAGTIIASYDTDILMESYPSGVYYMKVHFKPIRGALKTGIYKIIKL